MTSSFAHWRRRRGLLRVCCAQSSAAPSSPSSAPSCGLSAHCHQSHLLHVHVCPTTALRGGVSHHGQSRPEWLAVARATGGCHAALPLAGSRHAQRRASSAGLRWRGRLRGRGDGLSLSLVWERPGAGLFLLPTAPCLKGYVYAQQVLCTCFSYPVHSSTHAPTYSLCPLAA